ncbi:TetR/AcrR family transcriptional regulator [Nakamurella endophytica]|uniref:TetR family transcriptional regulator n=1 Tax=Nakamurella endophytica TaxID=1748367 RepID=A0A917SQ68_9ACTN|nr:TetR/AcrR family transcriptional regulator [Nakamurella endophytica]GGL92573.1 TetR family transcriptional regulator [Nakamurella endophytica]
MVVESLSGRIPAEQRREQILDAAIEQFGLSGYAGTTTDQVARAAGISQPYVVRMFGSKERLYVAAVERARDAVLDAFRAVLAAPAAEPDGHLMARLGAAYIDLVQDRGILRMLMQGFLGGADPVVGPVARAGFLEIYRMLRDEAGLAAADAVDFLAHGMLYNTLLTLALPEAADDTGRELLECAFGAKLDLVLRAVGPGSGSSGRA